MDLIDIVRQTAPYLESWIERQRDFSHTPGVQVAVRVGDELGASFALGSSNLRTGEDLTTAHLFHIASHSKTFTATAVMQPTSEPSSTTCPAMPRRPRRASTPPPRR